MRNLLIPASISQIGWSNETVLVSDEIGNLRNKSQTSFVTMLVSRTRA
jgi:hypothetical protein